MKSKGIANIDQYYSYLQSMEQQKEKVEEHVRMDVAALRATVEEVKNNNNKSNSQAPNKKSMIPGFSFFLSRSAKGIFSSKNNNTEEEDMLERIRGRWPEFMKKASGVISLSMKKSTTPKKPLPKKKDYGANKAFSFGSPSSPNSRITTQRDVEEGNLIRDSHTKDSEDLAVSRSYSLGESLGDALSRNDEKDETNGSASEYGRTFGTNNGFSDRPNTAAMIQPEFDEMGFPSHSHSHKSSPIAKNSQITMSEGSKKVKEKEESTRKVEAEIAANFPLGSPILYFETVQVIILLTSLYLALWVTNFVIAAESATWKVLTLLPGLGAAIVYMLIVRTATLLKSVSSLDKEAVLEVLEQTESSRLLGITMREKILSRLKDLGDPQAELYTLFHEIDSSRNGSLSREEFASFLNAIEINFSRKKWKQIFREIDLNYDDEISFEEFFLFLFPDHDVGLALEKRRMKLLGTRVKIKADRYEKESTRRRTSLLQAVQSLVTSQHAPILPTTTDKEETVNRKKEPDTTISKAVPGGGGVGIVSPRSSIISLGRVTGSPASPDNTNNKKGVTTGSPTQRNGPQAQTSGHHQSIHNNTSQHNSHHHNHSNNNSRNSSNHPSANNTPRRNSIQANQGKEGVQNSARTSHRSSSIIISPRITELISPRSSVVVPENQNELLEAQREAEENRGIAALAHMVSEDRRSPNRSPHLSPRRDSTNHNNNHNNGSISPLRPQLPRP